MLDYVPFYRHSLNNARHCNEVDEWRASHKANIDCKKAIEDLIAVNYKDNHFNPDFAVDVIKEFGFDRVNFILQYNLKQARNDGRYSEKNKEWGTELYAPESNMRMDYLIGSHPILLDSFIDKVRNEWDNFNLWNSSHCISKTVLNLEGRILVIDPSCLADKYKTPDDQLFYARSGFGCRPNAIGRTVSGYFVKDDERYTWNRADFIGILKDEFIPDWVREKYDLEDTTEPVEDGGMSMS